MSERGMRKEKAPGPDGVRPGLEMLACLPGRSVEWLLRNQQSTRDPHGVRSIHRHARQRREHPRAVALHSAPNFNELVVDDVWEADLGGASEVNRAPGPSSSRRRASDLQ